MKKSSVKMVLVATLCLAFVNVEAQGIKGVLDKAKSAVNNAVGGKVATKPNATAKAVAPDVKNSVSELRSLTGLSKADFDKKVKALGYVEGTDDTGGLLGGSTVYKSKTKGVYLTVKMGTRGSDLFTMEVTKITYTKKADLAVMKTNFLALGKLCTDLKAEFKYANVEERGKLLSGIGAKNATNRTAKFLPALDTMIASKKEFFVTDEYTEKDYQYRINFYNIKLDGSALLQITVVDNTVDSQEG